MREELRAITEVVHGCARFEKPGCVLYVDPYMLKGAPHDADVVIITHGHDDHYSPRDIERILKADTRFYTTSQLVDKLVETFKLAPSQVTAVRQGESCAVQEGTGFDAVLAENQNHPADAGFGVVLTFGGYRYYLSGDTDVLDASVDCDVLFCVCDGKYNMPDYLNRAPQQIAAMQKAPGFVVPYHYSNADEPGHGEKLAEKLNDMGIAAGVFPFAE